MGGCEKGEWPDAREKEGRWWWLRFASGNGGLELEGGPRLRGGAWRGVVLWVLWVLCVWELCSAVCGGAV